MLRRKLKAKPKPKPKPASPPAEIHVEEVPNFPWERDCQREMVLKGTLSLPFETGPLSINPPSALCSRERKSPATRDNCQVAGATYRALNGSASALLAGLITVHGVHVELLATGKVPLAAEKALNANKG